MTSFDPTPWLGQFGLNALRPSQETIIQNIMSGRDAFVVLPTGAGKSLCYQLPALASPGLTIVVSPLLALMRDQISYLNRNEKIAHMLSSEDDDDARFAIWQDLKHGAIKLLYLSPEQLAKTTTRHMLSRIQLARLVLDEAHCFSEWGHDFRPDYRRLPDFAKTRQIPIAAFTATASQPVIDDLRRQLFAGRDVWSHFTPVLRENIKLEFAAKNQPRQQLLDRLGPAPTLIYAMTRNKTEVLAQAIQTHGFAANHYHAGLEPEIRRQRERDFMAGKLQIMVATNAFGMGVDKPDIEQVIHADMPPSPESYIQELGRAGRDGRAARAFCLFGDTDFDMRRDMIEKSVHSDQQRGLALKRLEIMHNICLTHGGWPALSTYFEENIISDPVIPTHTDTALERWRYRVAQQKKMPPYRVLPDHIMTQIKSKSPKTLDQLAAISGMGEKRIANYAAGILEVYGATEVIKKRRQKIAHSGDGGLFDALQQRVLDLRYGVHGGERPLMISNAVLARIAKAKPATMDELKRISGITPAICDRFGVDILLEISKVRG